MLSMPSPCRKTTGGVFRAAPGAGLRCCTCRRTPLATISVICPGPGREGASGRGVDDVADHRADAHADDLIEVQVGEETREIDLSAVVLGEPGAQLDELDALHLQVVLERGVHVDGQVEQV